MANQKLGQLGAVCGGGYLSTYSTVTARYRTEKSTSNKFWNTT
jgi:hypothetical protein